MTMRQLTVGGPMVEAKWDPNAGRWQEGSQNWTGDWVRDPNAPIAPPPAAAPFAPPPAVRTPAQNAAGFAPAANPTAPTFNVPGAAPTATAANYGGPAMPTDSMWGQSFFNPSAQTNMPQLNMQQLMAGKGSSGGPSGMQMPGQVQQQTYAPATAAPMDFHNQLQNFINSGLLGGQSRLRG